MWFAKNPVSFDNVKFIRNFHNRNSPINMCKEFHEVDEFAASLLLDILKKPEHAPPPKLNPFTPVSVVENLN